MNTHTHTHTNAPMAEAILQNLILLTFWYNPMRDFGTPILEAHATIFP